MGQIGCSALRGNAPELGACPGEKTPDHLKTKASVRNIAHKDRTCQIKCSFFATEVWQFSDMAVADYKTVQHTDYRRFGIF
jgi:hypothetical protein